jgi:UDP-glucose 4-epimerase
MKALVTGGAGFIGSNVVAQLASSGHGAVVIDDLSTGYEENLRGLSVEFVRGDVCDADSVARAMRGCSTVFHLAASVGNVKSVENPVEDSRVNVLGTVNVLEAARKAGVEAVVYSSSAATFGELVTMPIAEDHPQNPDSPYGVSKLAAEKHVLCYGRLHGFRAVCLRYFNAYGVNQRYDAYGNVIPIFAERLLAGDRLTIYGDGEQTRDFVNVKDIARANDLAAVRDVPSGAYNIGCGESITINKLAELIQEASGMRAAAVVHAPPRPCEVRHCRADVTKARREFGFDPSADMVDGLGEYFRWFKKMKLSG